MSQELCKDGDVTATEDPRETEVLRGKGRALKQF